jgi:AcrR family transcriptional regulator
MGITKAAVYHHFRTREELLRELAAPAMADMRAAVADAEAQRTPNARAERMLAGFVDLTLRHCDVARLITADQAIVHLFETQGHFDELVEKPISLLAGNTPEPAGRFNAALAMAGIAMTASRSRAPRKLASSPARRVSPADPAGNDPAAGPDTVGTDGAGTDGAGLDGAGLDEDTLRRLLLDAGRRILGLRTPRATAR